MYFGKVLYDYSGVFQSFFKISKNIINMFNSHRQSDHSRRNTGLPQLFIIHLTVSVACRMKNHSLGGSNMSTDIGKFQAVHETACCLASAFQLEGDHTAGAVWQIFFCKGMVFVSRKSGINNLGNLFM